jgi:hypothetical protein
MSNATLIAHKPVDYRRHYRLGFNAGGRYEDGGLDKQEALHKAKYSPTNEQWHAWMDGYLDRASREFGHIPNCPGHGSNDCGEA